MKAAPSLLFLIAAAVLGIAMVPTDAWACKCIGNLTDRKAYAQADVVVLATAASVTSIDKSAQATKIVVSVETAWKQAASGSLTVYTDGTCAFDFVQGAKYVLYLTRAKGESWGTSICAGNRAMDDAAPLIRWLDEHGRRF